MGERHQPFHESWRRRVQILVRDAEDVFRHNGLHGLPAAVSHDLFQRHPVASAAPGSHHYIRIFRKNLRRRDLLAWASNELTSGGI